MNSLIEKWDARYRGRSVAEAKPCSLLQAYAHLLPASGSSLDLAAGLAGNGRFLAAQGLESEAWDISPLAVDMVNAWSESDGLSLRAECRDVENEPLPDRRFDVLVISYFLNRERMPDYLHMLNAGGLLYYQTYTRECVTPSGPKNPAFRLARNELLHLTASLETLVYREEGLCGDTAQGLRGEAMLVARRPC